MSIYGFQDGLPRTAKGTLSTDAATDILDADTIPNRQCVVVGLRLVNDSGGAKTPTVDVYDGTTAVPLRDNTSIADQAGESITLPGDFYELSQGDSIRVTNGNGLNWHVSYIEPYAPKAM